MYLVLLCWIVGTICDVVYLVLCVMFVGLLYHFGCCVFGVMCVVC